MYSCPKVFARCLTLEDVRLHDTRVDSKHEYTDQNVICVPSFIRRYNALTVVPTGATCAYLFHNKVQCEICAPCTHSQAAASVLDYYVKADDNKAVFLPIV